MPTSSGTRLGPYELTAPIGAGGMGEVWRARDTRLERDVAVKILPDNFSSNAQVKARFEREAKTISSLNHPNICTLFDVGHHEGINFLVMELIEGESLADRVERGPMPLPEVLRYGAQIADALDRAHKQGIVHRDLKPANVILTRSGAKLLDFGLAHIAGESDVFRGLSTVATHVRPLTQEGMILGTFQYMAPEQLEGKDVDARTDIFALGALLYEMATGKRAFDGATHASLIAAIVASNPQPISAISPAVPPALDHVVRKCLEKDPDERWQSAHDVASELRWLSEGGSQPGIATAVRMRRKAREHFAWIIAGLFALTTIAALIAFAMKPGDRKTTLYATLEPPADAVLVPYDLLGIALSPDGQTLAFAANSAAGGQQLWLRDLASMEARVLPGTEGASYPFWSPDGGRIAFFAAGKLKVLDLRGGSPKVIADAPTGRGGSWSGEDVILFAPNIRAAIHKVPAGGGKAEPVTHFDDTAEVTNRWPSFLPDGKHFLYVSRRRELRGEVGQLRLGSIESRDSTLLIEDATNAQYVEPGYILFGRGSDLYAWQFHLGKKILVGQPVPVHREKVSMWEAKNMLVFSASDDGTVVYLPQVTRESQLTWTSRDGRRLATLGSVAFNSTPRLSPDGTKLAVAIGEESPDLSDLWIVDVLRDSRIRITKETGRYQMPAWSPDARQLAFICQPEAVLDICVTSLSDSAVIQPLVTSPYWKIAAAWGRDGKHFYFSQQNPETNTDVMVIDTADPKKELRPVVATPFVEDDPEVSPDGKWLAYVSNESGRQEVYVQSTAGGPEHWQMSTEGGGQPRWTRGGAELLYAAHDGTLMSVAIDSANGFHPAPPKPLFRLPERPDRVNPIFEDVTLDGERVLLNLPVNDSSRAAFRVLTNWPVQIAERSAQ